MNASVVNYLIAFYERILACKESSLGETHPESIELGKRLADLLATMLLFMVIGSEGDSSVLNERFRKTVATLNPQEQEVLGQRFGLKDGKRKSVRAVAQLLGTTVERIGQIEVKAFRKVRNPTRIRKLERGFTAPTSTSAMVDPGTIPAESLAELIRRSSRREG
jgi:hypothetical protein